MATIRAYTTIEQSRKLAGILPLKSADMRFCFSHDLEGRVIGHYPMIGREPSLGTIPCWSLAALLEYMNRNFYNISLNYCGSEYTISFDDGERYKTISKDYSIDAAFEMIVWLKENNRI